MNSSKGGSDESSRPAEALGNCPTLHLTVALPLSALTLSLEPLDVRSFKAPNRSAKSLARDR
jgi:hypothetical protein